MEFLVFYVRRFLAVEKSCGKVILFQFFLADDFYHEGHEGLEEKLKAEVMFVEIYCGLRWCLYNLVCAKFNWVLQGLTMSGHVDILQAVNNGF